MKPLLSPKVDFVFKKIFGSEGSEIILTSFLNAILKTNNIKTVNIKNIHSEKDYIIDKFSRIEVQATTECGNLINIELQLMRYYTKYYMTQQTLYYWSKLYGSQLSENENYDKLNKTICINILDFEFLKNDNFHHCFKLKEKTTNEELTDLQELYFVEIPKSKEPQNENDLLGIWMEFLKNPSGEIIATLEIKNELIKKALDKLSIISNKATDIAIYNERLKILRDEKSALETAELRGKAEGIKEGKIEAKKEGKIEGQIEVYYLEVGLSAQKIAEKLDVSINIVENTIQNLLKQST
ncbi:hypothetical protein AN639_09980 [Candidatus Epulonipiscium fishelsonii]|uniref:Uncharacterized protein n=1 Tax=Candidatus Epulonipiscium fishelsonii TaxID=77094 RepID=A0ACC8XA38_9FIRM|nr:hypothetical protein AN396_09620 [Epulopiscium sp. SCG-B11WGA-EpuloA1]ONI43765.1 hypothetical protein AN639_09980 [Epulopiscium sp. SCG-B05WGA-EpuloA1]